MPSFDIVSKVDKHEISNAVDQANREVNTRFDFKDSNARFEIKEETIHLTATSEFQVKQMCDILETKLSKRGVDTKTLSYEPPQISLHETRQLTKIRQGIDKDLAKKITKLIKDQKLKVQTAIQGEQVRVTGKNRDDLQEVIAMLRKEDLEIPLQFENFRD